ncbi:MAG: FprA family A-type flavoprotein [Candidatus Diapherotrites archaeon]|nr:FprA family A-type flavoprotein [Candidatus Diapherotrites archaeon]
MAVRLSDHVFAIPVVDRETDLFESLWPLDDGVNYNSYVVLGSDGAAIVDTVHESFFDEYLSALREVVDLESVKYVVINHMEPDHSSSLRDLLEYLPNARVVISKTGATLFNLPGDVLPVGDGDEVSLGDVTLRFIMTPWTHWPETMVTYVPQDGVAFTCDLFGAYGAYPDLKTDDWDGYLLEARRYYVTVLSKYSNFVNSATGKIRSLHPKILAPGHGVIYSGDSLNQILDLYDDWSSEHKEGRVLVLYGSMYGGVFSKVDALVAALEARGVVVDTLDMSREDWSYAMTFVLGADIVVVAYPTYDSHVFPPVRYFLETILDKGLLDGKPVFVLEAKAWSGAEQKIRAILGDRIVDYVSFSEKQPLGVDQIDAIAERIASYVYSDGS